MLHSSRLFGDPVPAGPTPTAALSPVDRAAARWPRPLVALAVATAVTTLVVTVLAVIDHIQVTGVDRWLKPWKFSVSITVYVLTLAWMSRLVRRRRRTALAVSGLAAGLLGLELAGVGRPGRRRGAPGVGGSGPAGGLAGLGLFVLLGPGARGRGRPLQPRPRAGRRLFSVMGLLVWVATLVLALLLLRERIAG